MSYQRLATQDDEFYELDQIPRPKNRRNAGREADANSSSKENSPKGSPTLNNRHQSVTELYPENVDFIYHTVKPEDTLPGISLRYGCTVDKLRHYNHFMSDVEYRALKVLKIPVFPNSARAGQIVDDLIVIDDDGVSTAPNAPTTKIINIGISNYLNQNGSSNYKQFLASLGKDISEIRRSTQEKFDAPNATGEEFVHIEPPHVPLLPTFSDASLTSSKLPSTQRSFLSCDGSDFGINWGYLLIGILFLCLVIPSYILYSLEQHSLQLEEHQHHLNGHHASGAIRFDHGAVDNNSNSSSAAFVTSAAVQQQEQDKPMNSTSGTNQRQESTAPSPV